MMKRSGSQIYPASDHLESAFKRLDNDQAVCQENRELTKRFVNTWLAKGYTKSRGVKLVYILRKLARILAKPFPQASKEDVIAFSRTLGVRTGGKHEMQVKRVNE